MTLRPAIAAALSLVTGLARAEPFDVEHFPGGPDRPAIVLARRPGQQATLRISFAAGAVEDGSRRGLTRLTQQALLAANRRVDYQALHLEIHGAAASLSVETELRESAFTLTADWRDFPGLARSLAEAVLAPRVDVKAMSRARARAVLDGKLPGRGSGLPHLLASLMVEDGRYLNEPYGDGDTPGTISSRDVQAHRERYLAPGNATVVVTGRFDRDEMLRFLRTFRGGRRSESGRPVVQLPVRARRRSSAETYLLAYPLALQSARGAATARMACAVLHAELWKRFREVGIGYTFEVFALRDRWADLLVLVVPAHDPSSVDLGSHLLEAIEAVKAGRFADDAFERARSTALAEMLELDRNPEALARELDAGSAWHARATAEAIRNVARADFVADVSAALAGDRALVAYFGPRP
ncbi:MAG: insulinase family protein [Deltaproteobacteria bacterium]|nr:insulinase family protein [Deltaproteobacteria bacterium]